MKRSLFLKIKNKFWLFYLKFEFIIEINLKKRDHEKIWQLSLHRLSETVWENSLSKKSTFSYRLLMLIFWKSISNLVIWQIFRIFGHSLTESQGLEESEWSLFRQFFRYSPFSLKEVPISQFWTKSNNSNTHFRAFFMLYTNQITKIKKYILWPN